MHLHRVYAGFSVKDHLQLLPDVAIRYNNAKASSDSDAVIVFQAMAGLMITAKEVRTGRYGNTEYLKKWWKLETGKMRLQDMVPRLMIWQAYIKPRTELRQKFLSYVIEGLPAQSPGILLATLEQVRMILKDWGLKSILYMEAFITTKNRSPELAPIAQHAVDLKERLKR